MANLVRIPVLFDLDDPTEAALYAAIVPMIKRHRASQFIRDTLARALGFCGETVTRLAMPAQDDWKAKRPVRVDPPAHDNFVDAENALENASDAFLSMFG